MSFKKESLADVQLHAAARRGDLVRLRHWLDSGRVYVDSRDKDYNTPLILAATAGHLPCVRELIEQGADPCIRRKTGAGPLFLAAQGGFTDIVALLIRNGCPVNSQCRDGGTALMVAAQNGHVDVCRHLLINGADIYKRMKDGATCLFLAAQNGQWRIVKMILEQDYHRRKISPGFKSSPNNWYADLPRFDGVTPLWMAAQMDNNHIIRLLLRAGASPTIPRNDGMSPLFKACQKGNENAVRELIQWNPSLGIGQNGESPLHAAVMQGNSRIVRMLLDAGADPYLTNRSRTTPFLLARKMRSGNISDLFANHRHSTSSDSSYPPTHTLL